MLNGETLVAFYLVPDSCGALFKSNIQSYYLSQTCKYDFYYNKIWLFDTLSSFLWLLRNKKNILLNNHFYGRVEIRKDRFNHVLITSTKSPNSIIFQGLKLSIEKWMMKAVCTITISTCPNSKKSKIVPQRELHHYLE